MRLFKSPPLREPRGVTVYTGETAEHYKTGDAWYLDEHGHLHVVDVSGEHIALYIMGSVIRVEAGPYTPPP